MSLPQMYTFVGAREREFAKTQGVKFPTQPSRNNDDDDDNAERQAEVDRYNAVIESPEAKEYLIQGITGLVSTAFRKVADEKFTGQRPTKMRVHIHNFQLVSSAQLFLISGADIFLATVEIIDLETGTTLSVLKELYVYEGRSGGLAGLVVAAASRPSEIVLAESAADHLDAWLSLEE